jgi:Zn-dependent protease
MLRKPVPVSVTWSSGIPMLLFGILFVIVSRNGSPSTVATAAICGALGGAGSLVVHELGHVGAARRTDGVVPLRVALIAFGAATHLEGSYRSGKDQIRVAFAGPAASLALAVPLTLAVALPLPGPLRFASFLLALLNVGLAFVSLVPLNPLDGHKLVVGLAWILAGSERRARELVRRATRLLMAIEAVGSVGLIIARPLAGGFVVLIAALVYVERHFAGASRLLAFPRTAR